ncbi:MAG TPA: hypothetical protein VOA41_16785 [Candidatus Dormibacteraeota bacterium]|nr:hypothetical protein [Candidatus Dormibacteraeota bacterium]
MLRDTLEKELIAIATDVLDHGPECELLRGMKTISETKYARALSLTNEMRKTYLRLKTPKAVNGVAPTGPSSQVQC